jgi:hypothetical protein
MKLRHEKHKRNLVKQYKDQERRISNCSFNAFEILFTIQTNCIGTFYSNRFKK